MGKEMRKPLTAVGLAALALSFAACSDLTSGFGLNDATGSFQLQTFNGFNLPAVWFQNAVEQDLLMNETFTIYSDGSYTDDYTIRASGRNGTVDTPYRDQGTWQRNNTAFQFRNASTGDVFTGSINGNQLLITQQGDTYVFRR